MLTPENVTRTLQTTLGDMVASRSESTPLRQDQNLLELVDSFGLAELVLELEQAFNIELPLDQIDISEIVHVENLVAFISDRY